MPLVPSLEFSEPFRPDCINKCLTGLGGAPFPDSSGKIKDKWRIIDSQLSAKGISMTELLRSLSLSLSQSPPALLATHLPPCLVRCSAPTPSWHRQRHPRSTLSINTQQKGKKLLKTSVNVIRIRGEESDLIWNGNFEFAQGINCASANIESVVMVPFSSHAHIKQRCRQIENKKKQPHLTQTNINQGSFLYALCRSHHTDAFVLVRSCS